MPPVNMLIKPASSLCNMNCKYCFYADVSDNREVKFYGMMDDETLETLVKKAFEYAEGYAGFAFQGGEPTLAGLDFYKKLIALQKKYNTKNIAVNNSLQTNCYDIDEEWAEFFAENKFLIGVSLDGTKELHDSFRVDKRQKGTYSRIVKNLQLLERHGVEYNILCVVNNFVARHPMEVYDNLKKYKYIQFIPCLDGFDGEKDKFSLTNERYSNFLKVTFDLYYRDFLSGKYTSIRNFDNYIRMMMGQRPENCAMNGVCNCYFLVESNGDVFPCDFYVLDEWKIGNVKTDSFSGMMNSENARRFVELSVQKDPKCGQCKFYYICRGGCRRDREPVIGERMSLNRLCESYEQFFEYSCGKMRELAMFASKNRG